MVVLQAMIRGSHAGLRFPVSPLNYAILKSLCLAQYLIINLIVFGWGEGPGIPLCTPVKLSSIKWSAYKMHGNIVQELCESRGGCPGLSVLTSLLVSVDIKLY